MAAQLAPIGRALSGGYRRLVWSDADLELRAWFEASAARLGLEFEADGNGNLWATWHPELAGPALVIGSHLDSVPDGGALDGPLGVISSLAAVSHLAAAGFVPTKPVTVAAFSDEEGGRFGIACAGSRLLTGALDPDAARALVDRDGISQQDAMARAGHDVSRLGPDHLRLAKIGAYVELHVEQGHFPFARPADARGDDGAPAHGLASAGRTLGVGTEIWPHGRWRIDIQGTPNHAGATRMQDRDDPLVPAARAVLAVDEAARRHDALGTVGRLNVVPGAVNAIAASTQLWIDARGADLERVEKVIADVEAASGQTAVQESWTASTHFDEALTARVAGAIAPFVDGDVPWLPCGAGHDAGVLSLAGVPTAMIFVRNPTGVSHAPNEAADEADCAIGIQALAEVVRELAGAAITGSGLAGPAS
ncbi:hypothetical protein AX769_00445 [Frondihabitans sp. PAMC 28766]|nr:hypothetical protein AX769_00445 [Frondihabitans sp. PAMC 28766]